VAAAGGPGSKVLAEFQQKYKVTEQSYHSKGLTGNPLRRVLVHLPELLETLADAYLKSDAERVDFWAARGCQAPENESGRLEAFNKVRSSLASIGANLCDIFELSGAARDLEPDEISKMQDICPAYANEIVEFERVQGLAETEPAAGSAAAGGSGPSGASGAGSDEDGAAADGEETEDYSPASMPHKRWVIAVLMPWFAKEYHSIGLFSEGPIESFHAIVNRILRNYGKMRGKQLAEAYLVGVAAACHQGARDRDAVVKQTMARGPRNL